MTSRTASRVKLSGGSLKPWGVIVLSCFLGSGFAPGLRGEETALPAMTTKPTALFAPDDSSRPSGELPPGVSIELLELNQPEGFILIRYDRAQGDSAKALVPLDQIEAAFYATPEPLPLQGSYFEAPTPTPSRKWGTWGRSPTPTPTPEPTPLPEHSETITTIQRTPLYSPERPQQLMGYFPPGIEVIVLSNMPPSSSYVLYIKPDGGEVYAVCRRTELGLPPAPIGPVRSARGSRAATIHDWLQGIAGYNEAIAEQRKTGQKILLFFHTKWSEDSKTLARNLLHERDFRKATRDVLKVSINPEDGPDEARLVAKYEVSTIPTTLVLDATDAVPRKVKLLRNAYGVKKVLAADKAALTVLAPEAQAPPPAVTNAP